MNESMFEGLDLLLQKTIRQRPEDAKMETWVIKYRGRLVALGTHNKSRWTTLGHAKAALTDKLKYEVVRTIRRNNPDISWKKAEEMYYEFIDMLQERDILKFEKL